MKQCFSTAVGATSDVKTSKNKEHRILAKPSLVTSQKTHLTSSQGAIPAEEHDGADWSSTKPSGDAQTARECRQSKFAFKGGKIQVYFQKWDKSKFLKVTTSCTGGDKAGSRGGGDQGDFP